MVLKNTPLTKQRISMQQYDTDYVHTPSTTVAVKDQQDQIRLDVPHFNLQGMMQHTNAFSYGHVDGIRAYDRTIRGLRATSYKQVARAETITR